MATDRDALNASINNLGNLEAATAARLDELCKTLIGNSDMLSRRMNHHCQEIDLDRATMAQLHQELDDLKVDKVILEVRVDSMAECLCKCLEGSPRV